MTQLNGDIKAVGEVELAAEELLTALPDASKSIHQERQDAITCLLSTSEGWQQARDRLKGTFTAAPALFMVKEK